jgi:hypothetical protein
MYSDWDLQRRESCMIDSTTKKSLGFKARLLTKFYLLAFSIFLTGCILSPPIQVNYSPTSSKTFQGGFSTGKFVYLPYMNADLKKNQIKNHSLSLLFINEPVSDYFEKGVIIESRNMGLSSSDTSKRLNAEILNLDYDITDKWNLIADIEFSVKYTFMVSDEICTSKIVNVVNSGRAKFESQLNATFRDSLEELFNDENVRRCIT